MTDREETTCCPIPCDPDCNAVCHAAHDPVHKKEHWPWDCPAADRYDWGHPFVSEAIRRLRDERDLAGAQAAELLTERNEWKKRAQDGEVVRKIMKAGERLLEEGLTARAEKAEAALAELGEARLEWGVRTRDDDCDEDIEVVSSEVMAREFATTWRSEIPDANPTAMCRTARSVGPWRAADAAPCIALERATVEQGVQPVRCGSECSEGHTYEPGSCEAAIDPDEVIAQNHAAAMRDWGIAESGADDDVVEGLGEWIAANTEAAVAEYQQRWGEGERAMSELAAWRMFAHAQHDTHWHLGDRRFVEHHGLHWPIVEVEAAEVAEDDPGATHWGWIQTGKDEPIMIWPKLSLFTMCFPYGPHVEAGRGKGRIVRLAVRELAEEGDSNG